MKDKEKVFSLLKDMSAADSFTETSTLKEDLGLDSLGLVILLIKLEEACDIRLRESDMDPLRLKTVGDVITLSRKYQKEDA